MKNFIIFCWLVTVSFDFVCAQKPAVMLRDPFFVEKKTRAARVATFKPQLLGIVGQGKTIGAVIALADDEQHTVFQGDRVGGYRVVLVHKNKVGLQRGKRITTLWMN
ncbi:hypothetical protein K2W90_01340 [Candidatus Babeliales bacterium]|nr:hypothetical protein [Candidatus Babeliales bacterium]